MALSAGTRLGPYEITAEIGAGGMGVVYRARDTRLQRDVAVKVLPDAVANDPERLARFQREAQLLASLNHPNIAAIYGVEEQSDVVSGFSRTVHALVLELVEGDTLADRIARGPIPVDEALPIAKQITEALEAAHEQGIIHRDLKPANIKLREDGTVKVLDFGLAKFIDTGSGIKAPGSASATAAPTITSPAMMTHVGVIMGTAAYMSPEQARGKSVDRRADIWAFGCVLYEMLTGCRAFEAEDVSLTVSKVLQREPDFDALPANTPARVSQVLRLCLRKPLRERVPNMGAVRLAMQGAFETATERPAVTEGLLNLWQRPFPAGLIAAAVAIVSALVAWNTARPIPPTPQLARFEISLPSPEALDLSTSDHDLAISPDSARVVYRVRNAGRSFLAVRAIDELTARPLLGLNDGLNAGVGPFMSPDGAWVGFSDEGDGSLKRVSILGGPAIRICSTGAGLAGIAGASWGEDGSIVFGRAGGGLLRVPAAGGEPEEFTELASGETQHAWPEMLPGGRAVLFTIRRAGIENAQIAVLDLVTSQHKVLLPDGSYPRYASSGHIVYASGGALLAVPFDVARLSITGTAVPILESVVTKPSGAADFALAVDGTLVYISGEATNGRRTLAWVDRSGREEPLSAPPRSYNYPRISPDGMRVAIDIRDQEGDIWTWDFARQTLTRLTLSRGPDTYPVWSPDSRRLVFGSERAGGPTNLFLQAADGTGPAERLTESPNGQAPMTITPDGTRVVVRENGATGDTDLMLMSLEAVRPSTGSKRGEPGEPRRAEPLIQTTFAETNAEIAPDGRWLAYESNESGRDEVYVRPFPDVSGGRWQVSTGGGRMPLWSRNGQELVYLSPEGAIMAVPVRPDRAWRAGTPARVFQGDYYVGPARTFDIAPDGRRFLMIKEGSPDRAAPQNRIVFVQHWFEELKRLVPTN